MPKVPKTISFAPTDDRTRQALSLAQGIPPTTGQSSYSFTRPIPIYNHRVALSQILQPKSLAAAAQSDIGGQRQSITAGSALETFGVPLSNAGVAKRRREDDLENDYDIVDRNFDDNSFPGPSMSVSNTTKTYLTPDDGLAAVIPSVSEESGVCPTVMAADMVARTSTATMAMPETVSVQTTTRSARDLDLMKKRYPGIFYTCISLIM